VFGKNAEFGYPGSTEKMEILEDILRFFRVLGY
jgi:hypothetical protein